MSKGGSRYGRRSNWFKIHCLLQEQQQQAVEAANKAAANGGLPTNPNGSPAFGDMAAIQQQFSQRSSHLAAAGAPHLGYPSYLPEMSAAPFMSAAALPFFSMMNSLPTMAASSPTSAFQMPPHLLFPGYHPAAAAAAADVAYRSEMFKHRQSVDSAGSAESPSRFSPTNHSIHSLTHDDLQQQMSTQQQTESQRHSPELCVSGDDDEQDHKSFILQHSISPVSLQHQSQLPQIHSPLAVRASPVQQTIPETTFSVKMQSLSPVSVCSISHETSAMTSQYEEPMNQDCPMDLSMKTSRSSVHSDSDMLSESSEEERQQNLRRKFYQLDNAHENSDNSSDSEAAKRQKLAESQYASFGSHHAQRGIVCV